jgi:hypothetical protein
MRKRWNVVTGTTLAVVAAAGLGAGLSFGFGGDHVAARAANPQVRHAPHEVVRGPRGPQGPAAKSGAATAGRCGSTCFTMYSLRFGQTATLNAVINANDGSGGQVGRKINLQNAASRLPDGDFEMSFLAHVWQFCGTDVHDFFGPGSYICQHDSNFSVFEAEWAPYGNSTDLCAGVEKPNQAGEAITLRLCGASDHTLWIANQANGSGNSCRGAENYCPWMNGSDSNFRAPYVLTLDSSTFAPGNQLRLYPENLLPQGNQDRAWNNQEFAFYW